MNKLFKKQLGYRVDGILGAEFFNQFLWDVDGPGKTFRILTKADKSFAGFTPDYSFHCRFKGVPDCYLSKTHFDMDIGNASGIDAILPLFWVQKLYDLGLYNLTHIQEGYTGSKVIKEVHGIIPVMAIDHSYSIKNVAITSGPTARITFSFLSRGRTLINPRTGLVQTAGQKGRKPYVPVSLGLDLVKTDKGYLIHGKQQGCHMNLKNFQIGDYINSVRPYREGAYIILTEPAETVPAIYHSDDLPIAVTGFRGEKFISEVIHMAPACTPYISW